MACDRCNCYFSFWVIFCFFTPHFGKKSLAYDRLDLFKHEYTKRILIQHSAFIYMLIVHVSVYILISILRDNVFLLLNNNLYTIHTFQVKSSLNHGFLLLLKSLNSLFNISYQSFHFNFKTKVKRKVKEKRKKSSKVNKQYIFQKLLWITRWQTTLKKKTTCFLKSYVASLFTLFEKLCYL